jgi:hypothetical protein
MTRKFLLLSLELMFLSVLEACGGGGGNPGTISGGSAIPIVVNSPVGTGSVVVTTNNAAEPADIELSTSKTTLSSAGDSAVITAHIKSDGNVVLAGVTVKFSASNGMIAGGSSTTDSMGMASATLSTGTDTSKRSIVVNVQAATITRGITIQVVVLR